MSAWLGDTTRTNSGLELLARGRRETKTVLDAFREILMSDEGRDGVGFDVATLRTIATRSGSTIAGTRVEVQSTLEGARIPVSVEIACGDLVFPGPGQITYPGLLDDPVPQLRCYRRETVIAEALQRIVVAPSEPSSLSALRDLYLLARNFDFEAPALGRAIQATFRRRGTRLPETVPEVLSAGSNGLGLRQAQWRLVRGTDPLLKDADLVSDAARFVASFVGPILDAMAGPEFFIGIWKAGGPWQATRTSSDRRRAVRA